MTISDFLPEEVAKELAARFSSYLGVSSKTGYDWTTQSVVTNTYAASNFVSIPIKKGKVLA